MNGQGDVGDAAALSGPLYAALMKLYMRIRRTDMAGPGASELSGAQHSVVRLLTECGGMRVTDLARPNV